jgi:peptide subunit release factor 1 (eRF1)
MVCHVLEPLQPMDRNTYVCDKRFHIDEFLSLFQPPSELKHGYVVADGDTARFYTLADDSKSDVKLLQTISICRQKSQKKGGQSAPRFGRMQQNQVAAFVKLVAETANQLFLNKNGRPSIKTLAFGGTGGDKTGIYALTHVSPHLNRDLAQLVIGKWAAADITQLLTTSLNKRKEVDDSKSNGIIELFLDHVRRNTGCAIYGKEQLLLSTKHLQTIIHNNQVTPEELADLSIGPKTVCVQSNHPTIAQYGGIVAISFFPLTDATIDVANDVP